MPTQPTLMDTLRERMGAICLGRDLCLEAFPKPKTLG